MASSSDTTLVEEVIRKRLLIDGDGMGDERKLNSLIKSYLMILESDDTEENDRAAVQRFSAQIKQMEYIARRTIESIQMNEKAQEVYVDLDEQVRTGIVETKHQIEESKALLEEATKHRKYSMEYDSLAKLIDSKPDRKLTDSKRQKLDSDLERSRRRKFQLDEQLDTRKRSVTMLSSTIQLLQEHLDFADEESTMQGRPTRQKLVVFNEESDSDDDSTQMDTQSTFFNSQESSVSVKDSSEAKTGNGGPVPTSSKGNSTEKTKSEKYEDLSESDGDANS